MHISFAIFKVNHLAGKAAFTGLISRFASWHGDPPRWGSKVLIASNCLSTSLSKHGIRALHLDHFTLCAMYDSPVHVVQCFAIAVLVA